MDDRSPLDSGSGREGVAAAPLNLGLGVAQLLGFKMEQHGEDGEVTRIAGVPYELEALATARGC